MDLNTEQYMRVLIYKEDDFIVAQGLDLNIMASLEGDDVERLMMRFGLQMSMNANVDLPPVPREFEELWNAAEALSLGDNNITVRQAA